MEKFEVLSDPKKIYRKMLEDINNAKESIYLETYIYGDDKIGKLFRDALTKKAINGVKVKLLIDAWGSPRIKKGFFQKLTDFGGQVKFFKEIRYVIRLLSKNHERNHRKLLIIDKKITYIGSINITSECINWRELSLRIRGPIAEHFTYSFQKSWNIHGKLTKTKIKSMIHKGFEIINDIPSDAKKLTESRYANLINSAKKQILIETPYFVPPIRLRRALAKAVKRGVDVKILLPFISDLRFIDMIRNRYLGSLHRKGIKIYYYLPKTLHSKLLLVDDKFFLFGSSNLDYRSFIHQHEINLFGKDKNINYELCKFFTLGIKNSKPFNYKTWKNRSSLTKIIELFLSYISYYL